MTHDFKKHSSRAEVQTVAAALLLAAISACAQTPAPAAAAPPASAPDAAAGPAYTPSNIALAFSYIDANKDGKISREEAAGFRGVAKYFDEADVDKDGFLSREEFENAMNRSKPK
jgi:curli biogenesis system outer membrane secretion channel CsgG